jgi:hypothetical protein
MPTILDETVASSAYDTSGNGGRKIAFASTGDLVFAVKNGTTEIRLYKKVGTNAPVLLANFAVTSLTDVAIENVGNGYIGILYSHSGSTVSYRSVSVTLGTLGTIVNVDSGQTAVGNVTMIANDTKTELHMSVDTKNLTYPNSKNIRYAKGTINADGSVAWGAVEQVTSHNTSVDYIQNPSIVIWNDIPIILAESNLNGSLSSYAPSILVIKRDKSLSNTSNKVHSNWSIGNVYNGTSNYTQSSPSAIFVPSSVNGLPNGLIGNAWHGTDSASGGVNYIRFNKSTDLGANWSAPQKLVPGTNPTLTANRNGKLFITYEDNGVTKRIESTDNGDTWSTPITVGNGTNPSSIFDLSLNMSEPLTIRKGASSVLFSGVWVITTISVTPGYIGQKTSADKSNILSYSITTDGTMSDIIEKINGVTIATRTNPTSGQQFTVSLTQEQWDAIKYGNAHTLTITMGSDTWTYTFDKRLNANDDILSAVKGVQDLYDHLNAIKAQLGAAIRAKGGTVNDADPFSAFVSAITNMTNKRWVSGTAITPSSPSTFTHPNGTTSGAYPLTVTGLSFTPSTVLIFPTSTSNTWITILFPINLPRASGTGGRIIMLPFHNENITTGSTYNFALVSPAQIVNGGFTLPFYSPNVSVTWYAFE